MSSFLQYLHLPGEAQAFSRRRCVTWLEPASLMEGLKLALTRCSLRFLGLRLPKMILDSKIFLVAGDPRTSQFFSMHSLKPCWVGWNSVMAKKVCISSPSGFDMLVGPGGLSREVLDFAMASCIASSRAFSGYPRLVKCPFKVTQCSMNLSSLEHILLIRRNWL